MQCSEEGGKSSGSGGGTCNMTVIYIHICWGGDKEYT